jgi:competence protein ComEA
VIIVHVAGAVKKPNVYKLHLGARVYQAIDAAGGAKDNASLDSLNLAEKLTDGVKVYVPTRGETVPFAPSVGLVGTKSVPSSVANAKPSGRSEGAASDKLTDPKQGVVFLHSATLEQLERLPGVGPAIAQRILDYRHQVGGFKSIDDLQNVSGIGDKKFAKLRPFVRL